MARTFRPTVTSLEDRLTPSGNVGQEFVGVAGTFAERAGNNVQEVNRLAVGIEQAIQQCQGMPDCPVQLPAGALQQFTTILAQEKALAANMKHWEHAVQIYRPYFEGTQYHDYSVNDHNFHVYDRFIEVQEAKYLSQVNAWLSSMGIQDH